MYDTLSYKTCKKGEDCIHPDGPVLPITEFYRRGEHYIHNCCKECAKAYSRTKGHRRKSNRTTWRESEQNVINHLQSLGIYAVSGVASEWNWVDVVAWGCVRIEVKTSRLDQRGAFNFNLAPRVRQNWHKNDLILLVCDWDTGPTYHLFPKDHPLFNHSSGQAKDHIQYFPNPKHRKNRPVLTAEIMEKYRDNWSLIEDRRQAWGGHPL